MQTKTIMSQDFTTFIMIIIQKDTFTEGGEKGCGRQDALCIVGENVN